MKAAPRQRDILAGRGRRVTIPYDEPELQWLVRLCVNHLTPLQVRLMRMLAEEFVRQQMLEQAERADAEDTRTTH